MLSLLNDCKTKHLLSRVREDIAQLRGAVSSLVHHTKSHSLADGVSDLTEQAKRGLHSGGDFARLQLKHFREHPAKSSAGLLGGLLLLSAVGAGIYYLCKSDSCSNDHDDDFDEENDSDSRY